MAEVIEETITVAEIDMVEQEDTLVEAVETENREVLEITEAKEDLWIEGAVDLQTEDKVTREVVQAVIIMIEDIITTVAAHQDKLASSVDKRVTGLVNVL